MIHAHAIEHALRMSVRRVDDDDVDAGGDQRLDALLGVAAACRPRRRRASGQARPCDASGCSVDLRMSLTVMRPRNSIASLTTSTRSSRCRCISAFARSRSVPSGTVTSLSPLVMMFDDRLIEVGLEPQIAIGDDADARACRSTTGKPENPMRAASTPAPRAPTSLGGIVIGSLTTPLSKRLTFATSAACFARRHVLVHDTQAAFLRDGDGEPGFGHCVHRRRQQRNVERDAGGEAGLES